MAKVYSVQLEILLTADEKALLDHHVKELNWKIRENKGSFSFWNQWTLERLLKIITQEAVGKMVEQRSVWEVLRKLAPL